MSTTIINTTINDIAQDNELFLEFSNILQAYSANIVAEAERNLFKVKVTKRNVLFELYLNSFEEGHNRQWQNCSCCRSFFRRYGGLVTINPETGTTKSVLWNEEIVPEQYKAGVKLLRNIVESAAISEVFYTTDKRLGVVEAGGFNHFTMLTNGMMTNIGIAPTAGAASAISQERFKIFKRHLSLFKYTAVKATCDLFKTHADLKMYESARNNVIWLEDFMLNKVSHAKKIADNFAWYAVATQSIGRTSFANTVIGKFIDNIHCGNPLKYTISEFKAMTRPDVYMRPQAPPSAGNVEVAEKLFKELGITSASKRRYLRFDEIINFVWKPKEIVQTKETDERMFGNVKTKVDKEKQSTVLGIIDGGKMTWSRFMSTVLPTVDKLHSILQYNTKYSISFYVTASDKDSNPIFKYDSLEKRNQISKYAHRDGCSANTINLENNVEIEILGITHLPEGMLSDTPENSYVLILKGAKETKKVGLGIFPETLRSELYPVRATIEAFSNAGEIENIGDSIAGLSVYLNHDNINYVLIATVDGIRTKYLIDRFL